MLGAAGVPGLPLGLTQRLAPLLRRWSGCWWLSTLPGLCRLGRAVCALPALQAPVQLSKEGVIVLGLLKLLWKLCRRRGQPATSSQLR